MMEDGTSAFRFDFAAPNATAQEPEQNLPDVTNSAIPGLTSHCLIQKLEKNEPLAGDDDESGTLLPQPIEVFPDETGKITAFPTDPVVFQDGFTLLRGKVSTAKVSGVGKTDLLPGKYEGGLKLWECTIDLVNCMIREINDGQLFFQEKRVLELGCGHGLPGIFAILKGATSVHFQDFNAEVLRSLTVPNVLANILHSRQGTNIHSGVLSKSLQSTVGVHYYAGDWGNMDELLSVAVHDDYPIRHGYDIILMSETVYSLQSLPKLYRLIKKCLRFPDGVLFVAGKKHYFGVGGGTRQFKTLVDQDSVLEGRLVTDFADGVSNVREIWKFCFR